MSFVLQNNRSISEVLVDSLQLTKKYYRPLLKKSLPIVVVYGVLSLLINTFSTGAVLGSFETSGLMTQYNMDLAYILSSIAVFVSYFFLFAIMLFGLLWVRHIHQNESAAEFDLGYQLRKYLPGFILLGIVYGLSVVVGFLLLIIPGIYIFIALYGSYGVYIIERKGVIESLKRGYELSKGSWFFILGTMVLMYILSVGIYLLAGLPALIIGFLLGTSPEMFLMQDGFNFAFFIMVAFSTLSSIVSFLFYGVWGIYMGVLYFTLRERKEGGSIADEMAEFESDLSDESADDGFGKDDGLGSDPDSDRNNPDWR